MVDRYFDQALNQMISSFEVSDVNQGCFLKIATWIIANYNYALQLYEIKRALGLTQSNLNKKNSDLKKSIDNTCTIFNQFSSDETVNQQVSQICKKYINSAAEKIDTLNLLETNKVIITGDGVGNMTLCSEEAYNLCIVHINFCGIDAS